MKSFPRPALAFAVLGISALALTACTAPTSADPASTADAAQPTSDSMEATQAFIDDGLADLDGARLAYLTECAAANAYCQTRLKGAEDMAANVGAELTVFDANFDPNAQLAQTQDAITRDFDGYILSPVASTSGCANFELLQATGKPVATINSPMCGNADYTPGTVGFVGMQTESFFQEHVENAFASCDGECEAIAVGGFVGSDLFTRWEDAIQAAASKYPNVTVVSDQPGNFDPNTALGVVRDALAAHPDAELVISSWDDMTRGVEQGIIAAGKTPGEDVRIYSVGGTQDGVDRVVDGAWASTTILLPYEEAAYGVAQLARAIATGEDTPGFTYLAEASTVVDGPGTIFITADNASEFSPEY